MPLPQLHVDVGKRLVYALAHGNQAVIDADRPDHGNDNECEDDHGRSGHCQAPLSAIGGAIAVMTASDSGAALYRGSVRARREVLNSPHRRTLSQEDWPKRAAGQ